MKKQREKGKRKRITGALRIMLAFRNNYSNNSSSPQTFISLSFICVFSTFVHLLNP